MEFKNYSFKDLLDNIVDNRGKTCPVEETGMPLIATNCIKDDSLYPQYERVRYVSNETYNTWFRGHPEPEDIIFVCKGSPGRVAWAANPVPYCIAQDMVAIRANSNLIHPKFLFALLRNPKSQKSILNMHVGTMIPHFKKGDFSNLYFDIPLDLDYQKWAGEVYFDFCNKIELNKQTNQTLEQMAQTLFKSWFVDFDPVFDNLLTKVDFKLENLASDFPEVLLKRAQNRLLALDDKAKTALLSANSSSEEKSPEEMSSEEAPQKNIRQHFPSEFEHNEQLGWIPKGWEVSELSQLVKHQKGFPFKSAWYQDEGHLVVRVSDTTEDSINVNSCNKISEELAAEYSSYALKENDLVIATVGSWPPNYSSVVGKVIRVPRTAKEGLLNQNAVKLTVSSEYSFHQGFLHYSLKNPRFMSYIVNRAQGSANQASITLKSIFKFPMLIANDDVMKSFSAQVKFNFDKQNLNDEEIQSLTRLRDMLLPKLISGELQIP